MAISKEEVKYIANLARLGLSDTEVGHFQVQLEEILKYVDKLNKAKVAGISPMAHVLDIKNVYRRDVVRPSMDPEKVLKSSPAKEGQFFRVPKVIE